MNDHQPQIDLNGAHGNAIADAAEVAVRGVKELQSSNASLRDQLERLERTYVITLGDVDRLRADLATASRERDVASRFNIELVTQLRNVSTLVDECVKRAGAAAYAPTKRDDPSTLERTDDLDAKEKQIAAEPAIPHFLTEGPRK